MRAVCQRCGGERTDFDAVCPSCGHRPDGEGLLVAWLLSSHHLDDTRLAAAAERISAGQPLRPSRTQLERARQALGRTLRSDPGLDLRQRVGLLLVSFLLTPLVGLVAWWSWRVERPRAALEALALSLPASFVFTVLVPLWALVP